MNERLWGILLDSFPKLLSYGLRVTVPLTVLSFALALVISVIVALIQYAHVNVLQQLCRFYIWIVRGTPLLVQLWLVFYGLPSVGIVLSAFPTAVLVFGFNEGAYMAESVRGALDKTPPAMAQGINRYDRFLRQMSHIEAFPSWRAKAIFHVFGGMAHDWRGAYARKELVEFVLHGRTDLFSAPDPARTKAD